jgi:hypothetical protein
MNLGDSAVVLRPRSVPEVADLAFRLCFSLAFGVYLRLSLYSLLPVYALCLSLHYIWEFSWAYVWLVAFLLGPFVEAVYTIAVSQLMFSPSLGPRPVFSLFRKRIGALFRSLVIRFVGLLIGFLTMFIALPFVAVRLLLLDEACLLEGLSGNRAYERSHRLIENRGAGSAFLLLLLLLAIRSGSVILAELTSDGLVGDLLQLGRPFGWLFRDGGSAASLAGFFLAIPIVATVRFLYYIDSRTRADGWDIQLRFHAIRARAERERKAA